MHAFEAQGLWFLPTHPERRLGGTLHFSSQTGLTLSLTGSFQEAFVASAFETYKVIHGVVTDSRYGKMVTLIDCFPTQTTFAIPGFATETIRANRAYISAHLLNEQDLYFESFQARYDYLQDWSGLTGFDRLLTQTTVPGVTSMEYRQPQPVHFALGDNRAQLEARVSASQANRTFSLQEDVFLTFTGSQRLAPDQILERYASPFQDLLTFATDTPNAIHDFTVLSERLPGVLSDAPDPVHVLFQPLYVSKERSAILLPHDMLFGLSDLGSSKDDFLNRWFSFRRNCKASCDTFFSLQYAPPAHVESRFLLLLTACSLFDERRSVPSRPVVELVASARSQWPAILADQGRLWLDLMLPSQNELSLPWNLLVWIQDHIEVMRSLIGTNLESFVTTLLEARRHLYKHEEAREQSLAKLRGLFKTTEKLSWLLKARYLQELGFPIEQIRQLFSRNRRYLALVAGERE